jgi:beta-lactamase regulating signal transducer with metallopeptidase domain
VLLQCDAHTDDVAERHRRLELFSWLAAAKYPGDAKSASNLGQEEPVWTLAQSILLLWLTGVFCSAARAIHTHRVVARMLRRSDPLEDSSTRARVSSISRRMGISDLIALRTGRDVPVAAVVGVLKKTLLLPPGFENLPAERADMVLVHELAHIARGDSMSMVVSQVVTSLFWFNPVVRWCATRLRDLQEVAADSAVLALGYRPSSYAALLLDTLRELGGVSSTPPPVHSFTGRGLMGTRLRAILDPRSQHDTPVGLTSQLLGASVVLSVLAAAALPMGIGSLPAQEQPQFNRSLLNAKSLDSLIRPRCRSRPHDLADWIHHQSGNRHRCHAAG